MTGSPLTVWRKLTGTSQEELRKKLGIQGTGTISKWEARKVPAERVLDVERVTGISRHILRPDIYPPERVRA